MFKKIKPYLFSSLIALAVGALSAFLTKNRLPVFRAIRQPPFAPPFWVYAPVWTILFVLMGIGSAIIYKAKPQNPEKARTALGVYLAQLIVNFFWSIIFFNMQAYLFAFVWLLLLLALIAVMIYLFAKINRTAAYLQIPYFLWVCFAGVLNIMIYVLNR